MACRDFLVLQSAQQESVWKAAAQEAGRPAVASGAGLMNGVSACQDKPNMSVLDVAKAVSPY